MKIPTSLVHLASRAFMVASALNITDDVPLTLPKSMPPFAKAMDPSFSSFSLEFQYWPVYAGNASNEPNHYFNQLLNNLGSRTGKMPAIRVGGKSSFVLHAEFLAIAPPAIIVVAIDSRSTRCTGTSENRAYIDESFQVWNKSHLNEVFGPFLRRSNTTIGKDWYVIAGNLPAGTEFTFGIHLYDESEVAAQAQMLAEAFQGARAELTKDVTLKAIQIGNEQNFYFPTAAAFVSHWKTLAHTVMRSIKMGGDGNPLFWIGSEANGFDTAFSLMGSLEAGILDDEEIAKNNAILEEHHYSGALGIGPIPGGPPPGTLMDKVSIRSNLSTMYRGVLNAQTYDRTFYLVGTTISTRYAPHR